MPAIEVADLSHSYRSRTALQEVSFQVERGEMFVFLGPNGGGKTTLFRVLSTLVPVQRGAVSILGHDLRRDLMAIRRRIGVVFQAPSLDKKLTVVENIRYQAALYSLCGAKLRDRVAEMLRRLQLTDRADERVETLSGGLRRRVELAKGLIHRPDLILLDEPSVGLDPGARTDFWKLLGELRDEFQVTVAMTSHLLEEADKADRIAILDEGRLVAIGKPDDLRATVGGDSITIQTDDPRQLAEAIARQFAVSATVVDGAVRLEQADGHRWIPRLVEAFPQRIAAITLGKPTLEDVFIAKTGRRFLQAGKEAAHG